MDIMPIFRCVVDGVRRWIVSWARVGKAINIVLVGTLYCLGEEMAAAVVEMIINGLVVVFLHNG